MMRRGLPHDGRHHCQQRALLLLVERRAFRADTRRGFAPTPRWVCTQCGVTSDRPDLLCEPSPHPGHVALRPGGIKGTVQEGRGYPTTPGMR